MGLPLAMDDVLARPGIHTGKFHGRIRIGLFIRRDERLRKGPWYSVTCACGETFRVRGDAVLGPRAGRGCATCRRVASQEGNIEIEHEITRQVSKAQWAVALRNVAALTPQQKRDFALLMEGRALNYRNVVEAIGMAREGLTDADREMFRPKRPQELRVELRRHQGDHRLAFSRQLMNVRHD